MTNNVYSEFSSTTKETVKTDWEKASKHASLKPEGSESISEMT
jgi:hypothetical protein